MQAIKCFQKAILSVTVRTFKIPNSAKTVECSAVTSPTGKQTSQVLGTEMSRQINKRKCLFLEENLKRIEEKNLQNLQMSQILCDFFIRLFSSCHGTNLVAGVQL